jgi:ribose transport system substrate-binding protein
LTYFDGNFDPVAETNQMEQALATGNYTGWAVETESPDACSIIKQAIKKGILVSIYNGPQCKPITAPGVAAWEPGTLNFIAGDQTRASFQKWLNKIVSLNPGPQQMLVLEGPAAISQTSFTNEAIAQVEKSDPQMKIIAELVPAYTLAGADTATAAILTANPNLTIVAGNYSDLTLGAVVAIKAAGKMGNINVYDSGGSKQVISEIKAGEIKLSQPYLPATESVDAVESIINAWHGKLGPRYVDIMKSLPGGEQFITKANVNTFKAQF